MINGLWVCYPSCYATRQQVVKISWSICTPDQLPGDRTHGEHCYYLTSSKLVKFTFWSLLEKALYIDHYYYMGMYCELLLNQGFSTNFYNRPKRAKACSKIHVRGPNEHHCSMCFYVFQSWQRANQEWSAGWIWPMGRLLRTPVLNPHVRVHLIPLTCQMKSPYHTGTYQTDCGCCIWTAFICAHPFLYNSRCKEARLVLPPI